MTIPTHIPKWARAVATILGAALGLAFLLLGLSNTRTQAAPRLTGTGTDPLIEAITLSASIPVSDTRPGDGVNKTVYFNNASAGTITLDFDIRGTPTLTLTAGAAFNDATQNVSSDTSPWLPALGYSVETGAGDYPGVSYTAVNTDANETTVAISYVKDVASPSSSVSVPANGVYYSSLGTISGTASDGSGSGLSLVEIRILSGALNWNGSGWVGAETWLPVSGTTNWSRSTGLPTWQSGTSYTVQSRATDYVSNVETPGAGHTFTFDAASPSSSVSVPANGAYYSSLGTISGTASDSGGSGVSLVEVRILSGALNWNGSNWVAGETWLPVSGTTNWSCSTGLPTWQSGSSYTVRSRATDLASNVETPGTGNTFGFDTDPPLTSSPSIVEDSIYLYAVGTRLYYISTMSIAQPFALQGYSSDALSGVSRVTFSPAFGETPPDVTSGFSPWRSDAPGPTYGVDPGATAAGIITATVYDRAGNSSVQTYSYERDNTAPTSTASGPTYATTSPIAVTWVATDTQSGVYSTTLWYRKEVTGSWQAYQTLYAGSGTFSFVPSLGDGLYLFATVAADNLGNVEAGPTVSETQTIYDTAVPQSRVTWAPAYKNSSPITMTWVATPTQPQVLLTEVRLWYRLNAGTWTQTSISSTGSTTSGTFSFTPSGQGTYNFATVARDTLGKSEANPSGNGDATTIFDTAAPAVSISSPTAGSVLTTTLTSFSVTGTAVDATSGITQVWVTTGTNWVLASGLSPWTYNWTLPSADRVTYTLAARSRDNAGNMGTSSSVNVIVDTVAPTAATPAPNRSPWITSTVVYAWPPSSDGAGIASYSVLITNTWDYFATFTTSATVFTFTQAYTHDAYYYAQVRAIDRSGNTGPASASSTGVRTDLVLPVTANAAIDDNSSYLYVTGRTLYYTNTMPTAVPFTVTGTAYDTLSGLDKATFSRTFSQTPPNDTTPDVFAGVYNVTPGATGNGLITATVYDRAGNASTETYTYTLDGTPPTSTASAPAYATTSPIAVTWAAADTQSGVYSTTLWYKKEVTGSWQSYQTINASSGTFSFVPPLSDGLYLFATVAADNLANVEPRPTVSETQTIYDTKVPQSQVTWAPAYRNSSPITMTWVATPFLAPLVEVRLWYRLNAGTWTQTSIVSTGSATSGVFSFVPSADGVYEFATVARDAFAKSEGNPSGSGDASTVYDTQIAAPQGLASSPADWTSINSFAVTWSNPAELSGIVGAYYKLDSPPSAWNDGTWMPGDNRVQIAGISVNGEGAHQLYVWLRDAAGNVNPAARQMVTLRYDRTSPTSVVVVAPAKTTDTQFLVSWSANDALSGIAYFSVEYISTQDVNWQAWLPSTTAPSALFAVPATGMDYTFRVTAYDLAGNQAQGMAQTRVVPYRTYLPAVTLRWLWWYQYDVYEPNDAPEQAYGPLVSGQVYRGYIWDAKDLSDYYWLTPSASAAVRVALTNIPSGNDYDLYVYDYQGGYRLIASSNQSGNTNETVTFTPQAGRKYYVRVYSYSGSSSQQSYQLTVTYQ